MPALREIYSTEKTSEMVSQNILGFEDIDDMLKSLWFVNDISRDKTHLSYKTLSLALIIS